MSPHQMQSVDTPIASWPIGMYMAVTGTTANGARRTACSVLKNAADNGLAPNERAQPRPALPGVGCSDLLYASEQMLPTRVSLATKHALAELLGKRDNDALRSADVG